MSISDFLSRRAALEKEWRQEQLSRGWTARSKLNDAEIRELTEREWEHQGRLESLNGEHFGAVLNGARPATRKDLWGYIELVALPLAQTLPGAADGQLKLVLECCAELGAFFAKTPVPNRNAAEAIIELRRLANLLAELEAEPNKAEGETPALSERKYLILQALLDLDATSADARCTTAEIAERAEGKAADPEGFKRDVADLKKAGFIGTKIGANGGCWLITKGRNLAEKVSG